MTPDKADQIIKSMIGRQTEKARLRSLVENWLRRLTDGRTSMDRSEIEEWAEEALAALDEARKPWVR